VTVRANSDFLRGGSRENVVAAAELLLPVDVEFLVEIVEPVRVLELCHLLSEVTLTDTDFHTVALDGDIRLTIAVVTLHT